MLLKTFFIKAYFKYLVASGSRHSVHSPFVYTLVDGVLKNKKDNPAFTMINKLRTKLLKSSQVIEITDFGAGANRNKYKFRFESVGSIVKKSSINDRYGRLLFRLVEHFGPDTILELGTSVGLSTLYMAMAKPDAKVFTVEGCTAKSGLAASDFSALKVSNIMQHIGRFDIVIPDLLTQVGKLDFAFIDGNHTYDATVANFNALLSISHNDTVFVFDDIHWSKGMEKAWSEIMDHESVTVSLDCFRIGIVFLKKELSRQKFVIRF